MDIERGIQIYIHATSWRKGLLSMNVLSLCLTGKIFFSFIFERLFFLDIEFDVGEFIFFQHLKYLKYFSLFSSSLNGIGENLL